MASYTRQLPISLARMFENAIDGEHLPWLHSSTFSKVEILEQGSWGWRAKANLMPKSFMNAMLLELRLDRDKQQWITTTLAGLGKGTSISTKAIEISENEIEIVVDFYVPKLPQFLVPAYREKFIETYTKLYDEDLWMMATRQNELNRLKLGKGAQKSKSKKLGQLDAIKQNLPLAFDFNNHPYRLIEINEQLIAHSTVCPHMLGPLQDAKINKEGVAYTIMCPWHGYRFDVQTRVCTTGEKCNLSPAPTITLDEAGLVIASL